FLSLPLLFSFFNVAAPPAFYTLSLHDALPISCAGLCCRAMGNPLGGGRSYVAFSQHYAVNQWLAGKTAFSGCVDFERTAARDFGDRKSTRLNSSHLVISYAVFCLKKKRAARGGRSCCFASGGCFCIRDWMGLVRLGRLGSSMRSLRGAACGRGVGRLAARPRLAGG